MDCPQCQNDQIDDSGICPACGYRTPESELELDERVDLNPAGMIEVDYARGEHDSTPANEKPQWRQELSERLHAIRQKRELSDSLKSPRIEEKSRSIPHPPIPVIPPLTVPATKFVEGAPIRRAVPKPLTPIPRQKTLEPLPHQSPGEKPLARQEDTKDVRALIDNAVSRKPQPAIQPEEPIGFMDPIDREFPEQEGKLILLSRTLCGLVDLIVVLLCTGILILAADFASGIIALDAVSYLYFAFLFLLTYFFYSLFFLAASNQTIGMMITDLRVVGIYHERPSMRQLFQRCAGFLISLLGLGIGLIWGLFDRESLCFHDRISDTQMMRL
jgi:uncharacterized RDD family membrane protein YckC